MKWVVILLVCLYATTVFGQVSFNGSVFSKAGQPLPAAVISLLSTGDNLVADSTGHFILNAAQSRKYLIKVSYTGYNSITREVTLPGHGRFYLSETEQQLEQVVVTAVAGATRIRRTPVSVAIVSQKEMWRNTSSNVIDAVIKSTPGISAITTGPNISKPVIRGLGYTRVLTLYDGLRQEGQQWGDEHGVEIDQYGITRAEIVKGPASLMYGSDAIAGVVNLIPTLPLAADKNLHGDAIAEYQSNNRMTGNTFSLNHRGALLWSMRGSYKSAIDYHNKIDGRVYNTGFSEFNSSILLGWERSNFKQYLHGNLYDNLQEIPDGSRDSLSRQFTYQVSEADQDDVRNRPLVPASNFTARSVSALHQHIQHYRVYHKSTFMMGGGELATLFGFQQNRRREYNHPTITSQPGLDVQLNTWNCEIKYGFPEWKNWKLTWGVNGMYQQNINRDATDFPIPDYKLFDIGSYFIIKKEFRKLVLTGGLRIDNRQVGWNDFFTRKDHISGFMKQVPAADTTGATLSFPAYDHNFNGVSGSIGFVYNVSDAITIKANLARGYRCPSIPEIGSNGLDPGAHIYYIGNRDFRPEFNWQSDIGLLFNWPDAELNLELFNNNISDYIFFQKLFDANGKPLEIVPGNFTYQYRQGSARLYGAEASWIIHPVKLGWLQLQQQLTWTNGINTDKEALKLSGDDAKYLPLIPPFKTNSRLRITPSSRKKKQETFMQVELETAATQHHFYAVDDTETETAGYALVNLGAGISFSNKKAKPICSINISLNNLFDVAYQSHQNRLKYFEYYRNSPTNHYGICNMGRNLAVKLVFNW